MQEANSNISHFSKKTFSKSERLSSEILIKELFSKGSSFYLYPFKIFFHEKTNLSNTNQVLITVPKRSFKKAVDRNLLKRRIREAYRLRNNECFRDLLIDRAFSIGIIYTSKDKLAFDIIEKKLILVFRRLLKNINEEI